MQACGWALAYLDIDQRIFDPLVVLGCRITSLQRCSCNKQHKRPSCCACNIVQHEVGVLEAHGGKGMVVSQVDEHKQVNSAAWARIVRCGWLCFWKTLDTLVKS